MSMNKALLPVDPARIYTQTMVTVFSQTIMPVSHPPTDGSVLISQAVDFHLSRNPHSVVYIYADGDADGSKVITFLEFARACHRVAHAVRSPSLNPGETQVVAIIALCDTIVYQAMVLGIHKAGLVPFPVSPRNSPAAILKLLQATACHRVISTKVTLRQLIEDIELELAKDGREFLVSIEEAPSLEYTFPKLGAESEEDPFTPYPEYSERPGLSSIALYLHSSGSTGFPKAIPVTQQRILHWARMPPVTDVLSYHIPLKFGVMAIPSFHILGIYTQILVPIFSGRSVAVYPPTVNTKESLPVVPTPDNILDHARRTSCNGLVVIPALLQVWTHSPSALGFLKSLLFIYHGGGALPPKIGKELEIAGVISRPIYGSTEVGAPICFIPSADQHVDHEWQWMRFSDKVRPHWVPQGDGTYELHLLRNETDHLCVNNLPNESGYATSDLFEKHPTQEGLWRTVGRKDDVIVHTSGEKTVPVPLEDIITSSPLIQSAVMFGDRQSQPGVLVELQSPQMYPQNDGELEALRNDLWPVVDEANSIAPVFSRIYKDMILVASPSKPLPRTGKGTVVRKAAWRLYEAEISYLYNIIGSGVRSTSTINPENWVAEDLCAWLTRQANDLMPNKTFTINGDLFEQGFDSLSATLLRHRIVAALRTALGYNPSTEIFVTLIYDHPTIEQLAMALEKLALGPILPLGNKRSRMESLISYNISQFGPLDQSSSGTFVHNDAVVLLTGSTGALGSHLLAALLQYDSVVQVYTLNRSTSTSISERQHASFRDRGLDVSLLTSHKWVSLEGDLTKVDFGLQRNIYEQLQKSVTIIIHNAWKLDFNLALSAFEPLISGTRNLVNLARSSIHSSSIRFLFTSSISVAQSWKDDHPVQEELILDLSIAFGTGYGESKYVVERILAASGIEACALRIGQICGGQPNGAWSVADWVPILLKSSLVLKVLPDAKGMVSWIPMDCVAQAIVDTAFYDGPLPAVINIVHPRPVTWTSIFTAIRETLLERSRGHVDLPLVSFTRWFDALQAHADHVKEKDLSQLPAVKLLPFFQRMAEADEKAGKKDRQEVGGFPSFETTKAQIMSASLREVDEVERSDVSRWIKYWVNGGLLVEVT